MLSPAALSKKIGRKILYIGTECYSWQVTDFAKAARNARAMGFDTICPKRLDGTIKWYHTKDHLVLERNAVLSEGCGYLPFTYSYAPVFNTVSAEVAAWQEIASVNDGLVVIDIEAEWNGQTGYAQQLYNALSGFSGDIIATTWGDPYEQAFQQVVSILNPRISAWSPQQYTDWLQSVEKAEWGPELGKLYPSLDMSGEYGNWTHPITNAQTAFKNGHPTIFVWEYIVALKNPELIKGMLAFFGAKIDNIDPTPVPHPVTPAKKVTYATYIIKDGDTLSSISMNLQNDKKSAVTWEQLYTLNKTAIENTAKLHGYQGSNSGNLVFPDTQLVYPEA